MRKITDLAQRAFHNGYEFKRDNTEVKVKGNERRLYLFDNCIAKKVIGDGLYLSHCGWTTPTTKERLNGILSAYHNAYIYQENFQWYLRINSETVEFKSGWNKIE